MAGFTVIDSEGEEVSQPVNPAPRNPTMGSYDDGGHHPGYSSPWDDGSGQPRSYPIRAAGGGTEESPHRPRRAAREPRIEDIYIHPSTRKFVNADSPISVLVLGPSQNGKTTFINRLISMSATDTEKGEEGNKQHKCTVAVTRYELELPMTDYMLIDRKTGSTVDIPDIDQEEESILSTKSWKNYKSRDYIVRPANTKAPYLKLVLHDTPGLEDSDNKDFENMQDVLSTLTRLSKAESEWERSLNAVIIVYNAHNSFSNSFQDVIKHYRQCMPNLFGGISVVNTHFDLKTLDQKRTNLLRGMNLRPGEPARIKIARGRDETFRKLLGSEAPSSRQFFIDSCPKDTLAYPEVLSRNTVFDILECWKRSSPMPIKQMRLVKNKDMITIDAKLARAIQVAVTRWSGRLAGARATATKAQVLRSELQQSIESLNNIIAGCNGFLELYDNETVFKIRDEMTADDPGAAKLWFNTIFRNRITGSHTVSVPEYHEFTVDPIDSSKGRWVSHSRSGHSWTGNYEGFPGKSPNLLARIYTTNQVVHRDEIKKWGLERGQAMATLAEKQVLLEAHFGPGRDSSESEVDESLKELVSIVEAGKELVQHLSQPTPPVGIGFTDAARSRYSKLSSQITKEDVFEFVAEANLEVNLLRPLMQELADYHI